MDNNPDAAIQEEEEPAPLTKKQKKALAKAQAKERRRLQNLENAKLVLWDEFRRELDLSRRTADKVNEAWKVIVNSTKIEDLKTELEIWFDKMERDLSSKDEMIESLLDDIDQIHTMHSRSYYTHMKTVEYLDESFKVLSQVEKEMFERQSTDLITAFIDEMEEFEQKQQEVLQNIANIEINRCLYTETEIHADFHVYMQRMDERILQEIFRRYEYRDLTLERMREKYNEIIKFLNDLKNSSYDKDQFTKLKHFFERHRYYSGQFEKLEVYIARINKTYSEVQKEYMQVELDSQKKLHNLELEQKYFTKAYNRLKKEKEEIYALTTERMNILAYEGRKVLKFYKNMLSKGELLLSLAADCRKFQTQKEKIAPFEDNSEFDYDKLKNDFEFSIESLDLNDTLDINEADLQEQYMKMKVFWKRFSDVAHQNLILEQEKRALEEENTKLIEVFKRINRKDPKPSDLEGALAIKNLPSLSEPQYCPSSQTSADPHVKDKKRK